ncbi:uncharacterized protein LOC123667697 [Melitaea cinxia]|uniref:uncharacterized protein LOC123667697 n=1 Tax=Melitaea cinxia TaxID=113334 RepID=UPI001E273D1D|nr:uncharacterized protein LOC123667697 [Melitaea cinxia]
MMKRTGPRLGPDDPSPIPQSPAQIQHAGASNMHTLAQSAQPQLLGATAMLSVSGFGRGPTRATSPAVINYLKPNTVQYAPKQQQQVPPRLKVIYYTYNFIYTTSRPGKCCFAIMSTVLANGWLHWVRYPLMANICIGHTDACHALSVCVWRVNAVVYLLFIVTTYLILLFISQLVPQQAPLPIPGRQSPGLAAPLAAQPPGQFQRLKVEDALSYLDQVKYKFNTQPQVYNDFLDIMKEFKSQTIDTPGVITRVSNLFKGHPELIVGFNTFLPPGYKIEVQSNGQVSVSMPSPTGAGCGVGVGVGGVGGSVGVSGGVGVGGGPVLLGVHHAPPQSQLVHLLPVPQAVSSALAHNLAGAGGVGGAGAVGSAPANTLHHISQAHQQIEAAAHHHPPGSAPSSTGHAGAAAGQPVEFNHAIEYVNKIKSRFSRQPDKYKRFLEILHAYQRGHRDVKEPQAKQQTEQEVYSQVAKLFENQDDLLAEFGQFLPDAKAVTKPAHVLPPHSRSPPPQAPPPARDEERYAASPPHHAPHALALAQALPKHTSAPPAPPQHHHLKRSPSFGSSTQLASGAPPAKKARAGGSSPALRDVSLAEAAKLATAQDYAFFDRARKALRSQHVYENFLRCLLLFTNEIISSSELLGVTEPFLYRHPDLKKWLQDFLGPISPPHTPTTTHTSYNNFSSTSSILTCERSRLGSDTKRHEPLGAYGAQLRHERPQGDAAMDIDLSTCKRLGTSYCALPREAAARRCSGRTPLCKEVLNDTWVSFPTWSEDSTFVTSRKTQYEEYIYRCEDERFELDVVIETNAATIRVLEGVAKKLSRMSSEEAAKFRLDDCLGGHSPTIHQRALRRIYGDKVAVDIIAGLKKNPVVAVPVVLRRLKAKEEEWREAQKGFNKQWREQNEKYYLKSLDHQGINFKQNDLKALRSKCLFNEVESAYAARRPGPHLVADYGLRGRHEAIKIVRDAAELLIHHARRQTGIQKAEKRKIKQLLRHFLPDLFAHPRQPLSDDERDEEEKEEPNSPGSPSGDQTADEKGGSVKQEKQESSESDNASDKSSRNNKNDKENKPKNNNTTENKGMYLYTFIVFNEKISNAIKRSSSNEDAVNIKVEGKNDADLEDDYRDHPSNPGVWQEARFVCTSSWYLFLRLHGVLCQRLGAARRAAAALALADAEAERERTRAPSVAHALRLKPSNLPMDVSSPAEYYNALLELVKGVLDGNIDANAYEDAAREMLGIKAYPAYTLDKLVSIAVRQLQHCVSESWSARAAELAARGMRGPPAYVRRALRALRAHHTAFLVRVYGGDDCKVTFELLEAAGEGHASPHHDSSRLSPTNQVLQLRRSQSQFVLYHPTASYTHIPGDIPEIYHKKPKLRFSRSRSTNGETVSRLAAWSLYAESYARPDAGGAAGNKPVFLRRNARRAGAAAGAHAVSGAPDCAPAVRRRKPPRLHDHSECTLASTIRGAPDCAPAVRRRKPPRLHDHSECTLASTIRGAPDCAPAVRRRKPPRLHDHSECTLASTIRGAPDCAPAVRRRKPPRLHDHSECTLASTIRGAPDCAPAVRRRKPPRLHDHSECTLASTIRGAPDCAPAVRRRKPPRLHDHSECTLASTIRGAPDCAPAVRRRKPPRLHDHSECTLASTIRGAPDCAPAVRRRKPPRLHDHSECTLASTIRGAPDCAPAVRRRKPPRLHDHSECTLASTIRGAPDCAPAVRRRKPPRLHDHSECTLASTIRGAPDCAPAVRRRKPPRLHDHSECTLASTIRGAPDCAPAVRRRKPPRLHDHSECTLASTIRGAPDCAPAVRRRKPPRLHDHSECTLASTIRGAPDCAPAVRRRKPPRLHDHSECTLASTIRGAPDCAPAVRRRKPPRLHDHSECTLASTIRGAPDCAPAVRRRKPPRLHDHSECTLASTIRGAPDCAPAVRRRKPPRLHDHSECTLASTIRGAPDCAPAVRRRKPPRLHDHSECTLASTIRGAPDCAPAVRRRKPPRLHDHSECTLASTIRGAPDCAPAVRRRKPPRLHDHSECTLASTIRGAPDCAPAVRRRKPPRLHDHSECTLASTIRGAPDCAPAVRRRKPPRLHDHSECTLASTIRGAPDCAPAVRRRKPPRLHDHSECTLASTIRLVACRPQQLYRPGCLSLARSSHPRLSAARRSRFRAWLARRTFSNT